MAQRKERGIFFRPSPHGSQLHQGHRGDWWIRYVDQYGQLHREKVGPKSLVVEVYRKRKTEIREGKFFPEKLKQRSILFDEAFRDWLDYARSHKRTWRDDEEKRPRLLAVLKAIFNRAIKMGKAEANPVRGIKLFKENNARTQCLSGEEERYLFEALSDRLKPAVTVLLHTGMRLGDLLNLRWEDVDFYTGTLTIRQAKSGEGRRVPMNAVAREVLSDLRREQVQAARARGEGAREILSPYVFCSTTGSRFQNFYRDWYAAIKRTGLQDLRPHDLRHTFASRLVMAGVDLLTVKELLGHKTLAMTLRYSHLSPSHQRQAVERLTSRRTSTRIDTSERVSEEALTQPLETKAIGPIAQR